MNEDRLGRALLRAPVPDQEEAAERAWRVLSAAYAERDRTTPGRRRSLRLAWMAIAIGLLALLISPAGAAVRHWVRDAVDIGREPSSPALTSLPSPGQVLVDSPSGPWIVQEDGSKRRLGDYRESIFSPRGLFVAATTRHELLALDPQGEVRWSIARRGPVTHPSWNSPDGFRIAYLDDRSLRVIGGDGLRVIGGEGRGDGLLRQGVAEVEPAWRPGADHVLAFADPDGSVHAVAVDSDRELFDTGPAQVPVALAWSADGSRLLIARRSGVELVDAAGTPVKRVRAPAGTRISALAASPRGHRFALIVRSGGPTPRSALVLAGERGHSRRLFVGPGAFSGLAFSPDGRWLLLAWRSADQWVFLEPSGRQRIVAVSNISSQFSPGETGPTRFPRIAGWCCAAP